MEIKDKRNLFEELKTGLEDVKAFEEEKITLKIMTIEPQERKVLEADEIRAIRDKYNMSRAIFANFLRISTRTEERTLILSNQEWKNFQKIINTPKKPTNELRELMKLDGFNPYLTNS